MGVIRNIITRLFISIFKQNDELKEQNEDNPMSDLDTIENLGLIENGLQHIGLEINQTDISFFRLARESHLVLYRSMVEALKGSANIQVTGRRSQNRQAKYKFGNDPWKEIHKVQVPNCSKAWRFSEPAICDAPVIDRSSNRYPSDEDKYLIHFYDCLAMIQTQCHMKQFIHSKKMCVSDKAMRVLEWLHEQIRNVYEHFVPRLYIAQKRDLVIASIYSLRLAKNLLFNSGNVVFLDENKQLEIINLFDSLIDNLKGVLRDLCVASGSQGS